MHQLATILLNLKKSHLMNTTLFIYSHILRKTWVILSNGIVAFTSAPKMLCHPLQEDLVSLFRRRLLILIQHKKVRDCTLSMHRHHQKEYASKDLW